MPEAFHECKGVEGLNPIQVVPFGRYGAGLWTGHPIGPVIVFSVLLMGFAGLSEARRFFAGTVPLR